VIRKTSAAAIALLFIAAGHDFAQSQPPSQTTLVIDIQDVVQLPSEFGLAEGSEAFRSNGTWKLIWALPDCGTETARMGANAKPSITTETPSNSKGRQRKGQTR
jgi:hypothetical protein